MILMASARDEQARALDPPPVRRTVYGVRVAQKFAGDVLPKTLIVDHHEESRPDFIRAEIQSQNKHATRVIATTD